MSERPAIVTEGLKKAFGRVRAVDGVDLSVAPGSVFGLLGPNGAGTTTTVRILTTLLRPDGGRAEVMGHDVVRDADRLRASIGLAGQYAAVDETLTGRENLDLVGRLYHLDRAEARRRAEEVLERFGLAQAADRIVKTYSGGMRRRLDLGASLVGRPDVLFLDEPTTGLDPRSRLGLWELIRELVRGGTTLLLSTQYLDEADVLCDRIAVIDVGKIIAEGTADQLKGRVGGEVLEFRVPDRDRFADACAVAVALELGAPNMDKETGKVSVPVGERGSTAIIRAVRELDSAGIHVEDLALRRPTLDDVFLALTGHEAEVALEEAVANGKRGRRGRRER
ncbi:MAG: ATP-binding cassette domain-containing protein [Actinobacteria bacterium]|nr:ATP-binding cassette domain-containing protein [Actinomycetota bacterium]